MFAGRLPLAARHVASRRRPMTDAISVVPFAIVATCAGAMVARSPLATPRNPPWKLKGTDHMLSVPRRLHLPGRLSLEYVDHGDATGAPVIALHGVTDSWRSFEPLLPHLPRSLRLLALSQRGHGDSDKPAHGYRPRDFGGDVAAFMDALDIERAVVLGHSMGAANALRMALDHPSRVAGLVLAGASAALGGNDELAGLWRHDIAGLADPVPSDFANDFQLSTLAQPVPPGLLDTAVAESLKVPAAVWRAAFDGFMTEDMSAELGRIAAPTLIVWGRRDVITPEADQHLLRSAIQGARLLVYDQAGHALHWEEPRRFAADLASFVFATTASRLVALD
jgi:non-heme chloroperoxidase